MKKTIYVCDGKDCGAVLVNADDGFVITGTIRPAVLESAPLISGPPPTVSDPTPEISLCRECLALTLGIHAVKA